MTVTKVHKDPHALTMSITAEFQATVERVWQLWADPRQLERWWGPPTYPATFVDHDLSPGGGVTYFMTGPQGDEHHGWWRVLHVAAPHSLEFEDGFADEAGTADVTMPTTVSRVTLGERSGGGVSMIIETTFSSPAAMEQMIAMGMEEGMSAAMSQMDELLTI